MTTQEETHASFNNFTINIKFTLTPEKCGVQCHMDCGNTKAKAPRPLEKEINGTKAWRKWIETWGEAVLQVLKENHTTSDLFTLQVKIPCDREANGHISGPFQLICDEQMFQQSEFVNRLCPLVHNAVSQMMKGMDYTNVTTIFMEELKRIFEDLLMLNKMKEGDYSLLLHSLHVGDHHLVTTNPTVLSLWESGTGLDQAQDLSLCEDKDMPEKLRPRRRLPAGQSPQPAPRAASSSASRGHQPSQSRAIPTRTGPIGVAAQLPPDYRIAPARTLFCTTPGGTAIIHDGKFLLDCPNCPMVQTSPCHLPNIPGVTSPDTLTEDSKGEVNNLHNLSDHDRKHAAGDDTQFEMDAWLSRKD
ncbi:PREDICTED: uncharacterized protein LOC105819308 [Propithecus coquereli]|uniref:uncharacterized protein LOC105819308 n=1 Tax=Propithecus coquereli TaxID=379532 RepID=UPI00063EFF0D|nr:PREDICTED: uncharacterized protein LOC105819308 [Propithecus coquereli]